MVNDPIWVEHETNNAAGFAAVGVAILSISAVIVILGITALIQWWLA